MILRDAFPLATRCSGNCSGNIIGHEAAICFEATRRDSKSALHGRAVLRQFPFLTLPRHLIISVYKTKRHSRRHSTDICLFLLLAAIFYARPRFLRDTRDISYIASIHDAAHGLWLLRCHGIRCTPRRDTCRFLSCISACSFAARADTRSISA